METDILKEARVEERTLHLDLWYPRNNGNINTVELGITDVRAADNIRISYDFERDGYSIKQASRFEWAAHDAVLDPDWQEVAFIEAWAREESPEETAERMEKAAVAP